MGHGLVSLDLRDRLKVTEMNEQEIAATIEKSVKEYFKLINPRVAIFLPFTKHCSLTQHY